MKLHESEEEFKQLVTLTSQNLGIREVFIENDYWVTYALKNLSNSIHKDNVIFKGGTSLSKVYKLILRFSEDVDLAFIDTSEKPKKKDQKKFSKIDKSITLHPLENVSHSDEKKGPPQFRKTFHKYPRLVENSDFGDASDLLVLEINSFTSPTPYQEMPITSYIADFLEGSGQNEAIKEYELEAFNVNVLDKSRTLAEKLCGLAKFTNKEDEEDFSFFKSKIRHLYDVSKLLDDEELKEFIEKDEFIELVKTVKQEDIENFGNAPWTKKKFSEAKIYSDTDMVLEKVKSHFNTEFASLLYSSEKLPEIEYIGEQVKAVYEQLKKVDQSF